MKIMALGTIATASLMLVGCATNIAEPSPVDGPSVNKTISSPAPVSSTTWRFVGRDMFLLDGRVMGFDVRRKTLQLRIDQITPDGPLQTPTPSLPNPVHSTVTIWFTQSYPTKGPRKPVIGEEVQVWVGQYKAGSSNKVFLGNKDMTNSLYFKKHGKFLNAQGEQPIVLT